MKNKTLELITREKLIVIVRGIESEKLIPLAEALYKGGVRVMEITYSMKGDNSVTADAIKALTDYMQDRMCIGAGTVLTTEQVELTRQAGGRFIISPDTNTEVIKRTLELDMVSMPGALTPSEATAAYRAGADIIKLFPITNMGTDYVKAIRAPLSGIKFAAVGGIDEKNISDYIKTGIDCFGVGSNIVSKKSLADGNYEKITELAKDYIKIIRESCI